MKKCVDYNTRYPNWYDWKWQLANRITTAEGLSKILDVSPAEIEEISSCLSHFRMAITPYYASLIDPSDPNDPIRMQCVPLHSRAGPL